jgi:DNA-binding response OmpR family regulator
MDDYVSKPIHSLELFEKIDRLARQPQVARCESPDTA